MRRDSRTARSSHLISVGPSRTPRPSASVFVLDRGAGQLIQSQNLRFPCSRMLAVWPMARNYATRETRSKLRSTVPNVNRPTWARDAQDRCFLIRLRRRAPFSHEDAGAQTGSRQGRRQRAVRVKSVQAVRGRESSATAKWQDQGWECVSENRGTLRTELKFRRVKPKTFGAHLLSIVATFRRTQPKTQFVLVACCALILVAGITGIVALGHKGEAGRVERSAAQAQRLRQRTRRTDGTDDLVIVHRTERVLPSKLGKTRCSTKNMGLWCDVAEQDVSAR